MPCINLCLLRENFGLEEFCLCEISAFAILALVSRDQSFCLLSGVPKYRNFSTFSTGIESDSSWDGSLFFFCCLSYINSKMPDLEVSGCKCVLEMSSIIFIVTVIGEKRSQSVVTRGSSGASVTDRTPATNTFVVWS